MNDRFDVPICFFIFKRTSTLKRIVERVRAVNPQKIYLISDGPRTEEESEDVKKCRQYMESLIDWECDIEKIYAESNIGVYENIAGGAKKVLRKERYAIFLEDDNLPEITFFGFCKELLEKYESNERVFWICGTNYLQKYQPFDGSSYVFTQHLMPCGWASWKGKFEKYYDGNLNLLDNPDRIKSMKHRYTNQSLYKQQIEAAIQERHNYNVRGRYASWDFQMAVSIRDANLLGISPCNNQIENIGVDEFSTHGGSSIHNIMTKRFCTIKSYPLQFPLVHPQKQTVDTVYEKKVDKIILHPFPERARRWVARHIKLLLGKDKYASLKKDKVL